MSIAGELLYKTRAEIEAWLADNPPGLLSRPVLRWLVLDILFDRQHERCAGCEEPLGALIDFDLDHKIPSFKGGSDQIGNLQLLCVGCHRRKTKRDLSR